jgi:hypothetical protein
MVFRTITQKIFVHEEDGWLRRQQICLTMQVPEFESRNFIHVDMADYKIKLFEFLPGIKIGWIS